MYLLPTPLLEYVSEEPGKRPACSVQQVLTDAIVLIQPCHRSASLQKEGFFSI